MTGVCMGSEKSLKFHQSDTQITSVELWLTWHQNEGEFVCMREQQCPLSPLDPCAVFNWTNEDVLNWLEHYVELPEYSSAFREQQISGRQLPHIAINSGQILQNSLSITDSQHKQKIQLRAMDVILFGPPVQRGHWKDIILKISVLLIVCGTIYAFRQRRASQLRIDSFMEDLRLKEEEVKRLKSKFETLEREEAVDGSPTTSTISKQSSEEDMREGSPLMMAPTSGSSGSDDDSSTAQCK